MIEDPPDEFDVPAHMRPVLRESQREAIKALRDRRTWLRKQMAAARKAHRLYISDLMAQLRALPSDAVLAQQYGVSAPLVAYVGRGRQYKHKNILDEREQRA